MARRAAGALSAAAVALGGCAGTGGERAPEPPSWRPPAGRAAVLLERHAPVLVYDRRERYFATRVEAQQRGRHFAGDAVYGRLVRDRRGRTWAQYWLFSTYNPQDRGIVRTGRHEGDWEVVQVALGPRGPVAVVAAQHAWAEGCSWDRVQRAGARPVIFVAHASHASYLTPGEHGRPWPDPDDEARGDGRRVRPAVLSMDEPWLRRSGPWGGSDGGWVPGEQPSPRGPAFQRDRWDPAAFLAAARPCGSGAPGHPGAVLVAVALLAAAAAALLWRKARAG